MPFKWKEREKDYHKEYHAKWYQDNRDKVKETSKKTRQRKREWYRELKSRYSCSQCGASHPAIIDFHHKNPETKNFEVGQAMEKSKKKILAEIKKCESLCKNCHAILHWNESHG